MVDKLVNECTETVGQVKLAKDENSYKYSSCTVYTVLFWILFTINVGGIDTCFVYFYWYLKRDVTRVGFNTHTQADIYYTYKWEKFNKLTLKVELIIFTTIKLI